ncbi:uncharacterized protein ARMOST_14246 [Armillaria ostoyae]|uniref:Uncharacterized protein n=1 Tax=Armillaria ostoyae TaxID=47428 RepID=A0A284RPY9_ARMOS|nr:uncharacterized protein ARMOST_14246 [Armillaria ostoyae]
MYLALSVAIIITLLEDPTRNPGLCAANRKPQATSIDY